MINKLICLILGHKVYYRRNPQYEYLKDSTVIERWFNGYYEVCPRCGKKLSKLK